MFFRGILTEMCGINESFRLKISEYAHVYLSIEQMNGHIQKEKKIKAFKINSLLYLYIKADSTAAINCIIEYE